MRFASRRHLANAVTAVRIVLLPAMLWSVVHREVVAAPVVFLTIAASDYVDGRIARRYGVASRFGRVFDHLSDIVFILSTLTVYVALEKAPWWVPASIACSFAAYVGDSVFRSRKQGSPELIASRIGHLGGILNYALIGILVFNETAGLRWIPSSVLAGLFLAVPLYSGTGVLMRFLPMGPGEQLNGPKSSGG